MENLEKFIKENRLDFSGINNSNLNSDCCIISGYALHIGATEENVINAIWTVKKAKNINFLQELEKVFKFAEKKNYGKWWSTPEAKKMYKF